MYPHSAARAGELLAEMAGHALRAVSIERADGDALGVTALVRLRHTSRRGYRCLEAEKIAVGTHPDQARDTEVTA